MKTRFALLLAALVLLGVAVTSLGAAPASAAPGSATMVPTFSSVGVYWNPAGGAAGTAATVRYRPVGTTTWVPGQDLDFDARALGGRPAEYRGSIVGLAAGTTYEVQLGLAGTTTTVTQQVATWSESFPIATTIELPARSTKPVDVQQTGSPTGYVLVTGPGGGPATIDVQGKADYDLRLTNSAYVVVRGLTLTGARHNGLELGSGKDDAVHDVVVEGNTITSWGVPDASGFGTEMDSGIYSAASSLTRVVIQGNRITSPNTTSNSWSQTHNGTKHPGGPQGITLLRGQGDNVIRYNDIVGDATHHFNDAMGGTANFSYGGFPGRDSDVYGNYIAYTWDDGIEAEGSGMNVRLFDNYLTEVYHAFGMASVSLGPLYAYRNVLDVSRGDATATYGQAMFKMGGDTYGSSFFGDGRTYLYGNTTLKPVDGPRNRKAIEAGDGRVLRNTVTRDNILTTGAPSGSYSISDDSRSSTNDFDDDLYNGLVRASAGQEAHGVHAEPVYVAGWGMDPETHAGRFSLAAGSPGLDQGVVLPGFTGAFTGKAPDMGAQEAGSAPVTYGAQGFTARSTAGAAPAPASAAAPAPAAPTTGAPASSGPVGAADGGSPAPAATSAPVGSPATGAAARPATRTVVVTAQADSMVQQAEPQRTAGSATTLWSDGRTRSTAPSAVVSYLRFDVTGLAPGEEIAAAELSVRTAPVHGGTRNGPAVWRTADLASPGSLGTLTWASGRPAAEGAAAVGDFGVVARGSRVGTPLDGITGNGPVSLSLVPQSWDGFGFASAEAADPQDRPQLLLTVRTTGN